MLHGHDEQCADLNMKQAETSSLQCTNISSHTKNTVDFIAFLYLQCESHLRNGNHVISSNLKLASDRINSSGKFLLRSQVKWAAGKLSCRRLCNHTLYNFQRSRPCKRKIAGIRICRPLGSIYSDVEKNLEELRVRIKVQLIKPIDRCPSPVDEKRSNVTCHQLIFLLNIFLIPH